MASGEFVVHLRDSPRALGDLLAAPTRALRGIETRESGGFWILVAWCLAAAIGLRFTNLADAVVGFEAGGGLRIVAVLVGELTQAIPAALGAALAIVVLAGAKREPSVDLELGCAAAIPFLFTRAVFRTAVILVGREPPLRLVQASYVVAGAWTVALVVIAVRIARARPQSRAVDSSAAQHMRSRLVGWSALAVLVVALGASLTWTVRNVATLGPISQGAAAPDFTLPRVDGKPGELSLSAYRGRVVVLDFWATWCPPCLAALPMMHELSREVEPKGVTFIGVDSEGGQNSREEVASFLKDHGAPYPVVYDDGTANELYRIKVLPTIVVVGKGGAIERVFIGSTSKKTLASAIDAAASR
ncbi:MAG: TlpA family protein disulfide reductase [Deltaproteobacteria bacterium]|nr:TlpA family protein disulfide reductase [Deltaproteobacteria bacterium]